MQATYCKKSQNTTFFPIYLAELAELLQQYVRDTWPDGNVKIVRTPKHFGLINARLAGAEAATGDVIMFLDVHCEMSNGWLVSRHQTFTLLSGNFTLKYLSEHTSSLYNNATAHYGGISTGEIHFPWGKIT